MLADSWLNLYLTQFSHQTFILVWIQYSVCVLGNFLTLFAGCTLTPVMVTSYMFLISESLNESLNLFVQKTVINPGFIYRFMNTVNSDGLLFSHTVLCTCISIFRFKCRSEMHGSWITASFGTTVSSMMEHAQVYCFYSMLIELRLYGSYLW